MSTKTILLIALSTALAGCVTPAQRIPETAEGIAASAKRTTDPYTQTQTITAEPLIVPRAQYLLRFVRSITSSAELIQIYVDVRQSDWLFLERAADSLGKALPLSVIDHAVEKDATVNEIVGVEVSRGYLQAHVKNGLDLRIDGKRGQLPLNLPGWYIAGFLQAIPPAPETHTNESQQRTF